VPFEIEANPRARPGAQGKGTDRRPTVPAVAAFWVTVTASELSRRRGAGSGRAWGGSFLFAGEQALRAVSRLISCSNYPRPIGATAATAAGCRCAGKGDRRWFMEVAHVR
jgi:hypothetical protein